MAIRALRLAFVALTLLASAGLQAADFTIQTVDGLDRPLEDVAIRVSCFAAGHESFALELRSDSAGIAHGTYNSATCHSPWASVGKAGYESYSSGLRERNVLRKKFAEQDVERIAGMVPEQCLAELREFLGGENPYPKAVFFHEALLRPALIALAKDPLVTRVVRELLALIGLPEDLQLIMRLPAPPDVPGFPERWRYKVAAALTDPIDAAEWDFLRRCAFGEFRDGWVGVGAVQSLRMIATPESRRILGEAFPLNVQAQTQIAKAIKYIADDPVSLNGADLEALAQRIAPALNAGAWEKNEVPVYNKARDKALIAVEFQSGSDPLVYEATFHRTPKGWLFRGASEYSQQKAQTSLR